MDKQQVAKMDPNILLSLINMKLRNEFGTLRSLVQYYDLEQAELERKLLDNGYQYDPASNQFKPS